MRVTRISDLASATARGEKTTLTLTLENHEVKIDCVVAHYRVLSSYAVCGLELQFTDFVPQIGSDVSDRRVRAAVATAKASPP